ncbi:MAG TPA: NAD(P)H-dependent oxidoreductase subunit E [Methylomirabilota bacterium]|jgi:NADH:ubiquinone oxidoreductase subunit F (NADH-binding)/NADH:ubiquinone oxidoreductase subunit E|nr:NAD(P)H-dependent oxidoreductase subunit E [Methylomirabilota bacterium]
MTVADAVSHFPRERTWLLPALQAAQHADGWLSPETLAAVAAHLRVPKSEVWGVASHYPELRLAEPGARIVRVCTGVACGARGGDDLLARCERRLGVRAGETTRDGAITLEAMDCAFACAVAPVVEADHAYRGRVTADRLDALLAAPASHAAPPPLTGRGGPPATPPTSGSPGARFTMLRREAERRRTGARLAVGVGTCGLAVGAGETLEALRVEVQRRGLAWTVVAAGCNGMCWGAPVVEALRDGKPPITATGVTPEAVPRLLNALGANMAERDFATDPGWMAAQRRVLTERCGLADPYDIADALRHGTYGALARVLEDGRPEAVIEEIRAAGLAGRGGAYFQTAVKWAAARAAAGAPKYLVVNGEEGEPGIFKDRHLMEGDPHRLLEAALIAAYATGASRAILYVHGEANLAAERLAVAAAQARDWGLLGERVLGSELSLAVEIRRGAGGFVLGEETALLESIEGQRAMPRTRPPFPVESGLFGKPTVINNVETLFAVVPIAARGGAAFAALGGGRGTKLFGLSGDLARPGVVEMEVGCTLRTLIAELGGGAGVAAAVVGGPSGSVVHPRQFDEPLIPRGAVNPGTGGVVALRDAAAVRGAVRTLLAFNARESCGKCTPCREGTARMLTMLDAATPDVEGVRALAETVQLASLCGLGQAAPLAVLSGLGEFPREFGVS